MVWAPLKNIRLDDSLNSLIEARKFRMAQRGQKVRFGKIPKMLVPLSLEREYTRRLFYLVTLMVQKTNDRLVAALPNLISENEQNRPKVDADVVRNDDFVDRIKELIKVTELSVDDEFADRRLEQIATDMGGQVSDFNRREVTRVIERAVGANPFIAEPWLNDQMKLFVTDNVALIKTVKTRYFNEIESAVMRGARAGLRHEVIRQQIMERGDVARSNAKRIARDQVNKFNGQLNSLRQKSLSIKKYRWRTVSDNRVRDSHASREGQVYSWDDPPAGGHPGEDIQCRCWAEPILDDET